MKLSFIAILTLLTLPVFGQGSSGSYVLQDVRVIDGTGRAPVEHQSIVIANGKITQIVAASTNPKPAGAQVIQLSGKTVIPGLINGHGHVGLVEGTSVSPSHYTGLNVMRELVQYENYGVTTVMSLGLNKDLVYKLRSDQEKGNEPGATLLTAGRGIGIPKGQPALNVGADQIYRPSTPEQARAAVQQMASHSPNLIKIWVDNNMGKLPPPDPAIVAAVIDEAHRLNLRVAAHVYTLADAKMLLKDGADILAHSVRDQELDADTVSLIRNNKTYYIPTLQLEESFYGYADRPAWTETAFFRDGAGPKLETELNSQSYRDRVRKDPATEVHRKALQTAMVNLKKLQVATALIAFGTDSGANPYRIPGFAEHRELQLMVQAGMTPLEAIHSATQVNAQMLKVDERTGTLQAGKQADIVVLDADPSKDIANTEKINMVFHNGRKADRRSK